MSGYKIAIIIFYGKSFKKVFTCLHSYIIIIIIRYVAVNNKNTQLHVYKFTREERLIAFPPLHYGGGERVVLCHTDLTSHRTHQLLAEQEF